MEGKSVADERGRRERKFSERRRSEALVRERNVSEEVSGRAMRKLFCNRLHRKKKEALDNFHLMWRRLSELVNTFSELCLEKMWFLLNSVQIHENMEAKKKAERISVVFCYRKTIKRTTTEYFNFIDLHTIKDVI